MLVCWALNKEQQTVVFYGGHIQDLLLQSLQRLNTKSNTCRSCIHADGCPLVRLTACVLPATQCRLAGTLQEPCYNGPPAKTYPFELDSFQKTSVACLVRGGCCVWLTNACCSSKAGLKLQQLQQ